MIATSFTQVLRYNRGTSVGQERTLYLSVLSASSMVGSESRLRTSTSTLCVGANIQACCNTFHHLSGHLGEVGFYARAFCRRFIRRCSHLGMAIQRCGFLLTVVAFHEANLYLFSFSECLLGHPNRQMRAQIQARIHRGDFLKDVYDPRTT